jgi:glycerate 2-kinase
VTVETSSAVATATASGLPLSDLGPIQDVAGLLDHGLPVLRRIALDVVATGLRAADPAAAVRRQVRLDGNRLRVGGRSIDLDAVASIVVLGAGKASLGVVAALEELLGDRIREGLLVVRDRADSVLSRVEVVQTDHPVPSEASVAAGRRLVELADRCGPGDLVITAFTGGSSALACLPPDGVSMLAKRQLHELLLDCGASIAEVNTVRKHVSALKGGRLAARLAGATILNLTVSDVVGDSVDLLCDPTVQDTSDVQSAIRVLDRYGLWEQVSAEVRRHLASDAAVSPSLSSIDITTVVLVTGDVVAEQMAARVRELGGEPVLLGARLEGDAQCLGSLLGALGRESAVRGRPFPPGSVLIAAGGEATVSVRRSALDPVGEGGPNQEVAIGFARGVQGEPTVAAVFVDSDGSDGGTAAAGGCVDGATFTRARELGIDLDDALLRHDSASALGRLGDLVITGPTGTNISDLAVVVIGRPAPGPESAPLDGGAR